MTPPLWYRFLLVETLVQNSDVVMDCHVHLYQCFDTSRALGGLMAHLDRLAGPVGGVSLRRVALLYERQGERTCDRLVESSLAPMAIVDGGEPGVLLVQKDGMPALWLIAGRQINTAERIEVLAPAVNAAFEDGAPAREVIAAVQKAGSVPILAWAPGKWMFSRGILIRKLVAEASPGNLLLCDSAIRPSCSPPPQAMRQALAMGLGMIAGSDPLPIPGDDIWMGTYGIAVRAAFDTGQPATCVRKLLAGLRGDMHIAGRRGGMMAALRRLAAYAGKRCQA